MKHGRAKRRLAVRHIDEALDEEIRTRSTAAFEAILSNSNLDKFARDRAYQSALETITRAYLEETAANETTSISNSSFFDASSSSSSSTAARPPNYAVVRAAVERCWARQFRERILTKKSRCDGRLLDQLRLIRCETNLHEPLHGSSLFTRGQTQVLCTLSLDSLAVSLKCIDPVYGVKMEKHFMLDYSLHS